MKVQGHGMAKVTGDDQYSCAILLCIGNKKTNITLMLTYYDRDEWPYDTSFLKGNLLNISSIA